MPYFHTFCLISCFRVLQIKREKYEANIVSNGRKMSALFVFIIHGLVFPMSEHIFLFCARCDHIIFHLFVVRVHVEECVHMQFGFSFNDLVNVSFDDI